MKQIAIAIVLVGLDFSYWYARDKMMSVDKAINVFINIGLLILFLFSLTWTT